MIEKKKSPCYKCEAREPGCHGKCEKYAEWRENHEALRTARWEAIKDPARSVLIENRKTRNEKWRRQHHDAL